MLLVVPGGELNALTRSDSLRVSHGPTHEELKILLDATVILFMPCLKKIKHIVCLVQNVLTK